MKILMLERDKAEVQGIERFLKTYLSYDIQLLSLSDPTILMDTIEKQSPDFLFIEISLVNTSIEKQLSAIDIPIIASTGEPIFQHALKAVHIHAYQLFVKPIPLETLKATILSLPVKPIEQPHTNIHLYEALYLQDDTIIPLDERTFFFIECEQFADTLQFYHLTTTNQTIAAIAEDVGFVDHNYFSKVFRAYYQTTHYRYRMQRQKMS